jgi:hypothetical protein
MAGGVVKCRVKFCDNPMASRQLLCSDHWSLVPDELRRAIWQEYRPGQTRATATLDYLRLAARAVRVATERDRNNELERDRQTGERKR